MLEISPATGTILKKICVSNAIRICKKNQYLKHHMQTHAVRTQGSIDYELNKAVCQVIWAVFKMFGRCEGDHSDLLLLQQNFFDTATSLLNT